MLKLKKGNKTIRLSVAPSFAPSQRFYFILQYICLQIPKVGLIKPTNSDISIIYKCRSILTIFRPNTKYICHLYSPINPSTYVVRAKLNHLISVNVLSLKSYLSLTFSIISSAFLASVINCSTVARVNL